MASHRREQAEGREDDAGTRGARECSAREHGAAERGAVTAEFAVALPAVVLVLVAVLLIALAGAAKLQVSDAARAGARAAAAGESDTRIQEIARRVGGDDVVVTVVRADPWVTVRVRAHVSGGWFAGGLTATGEATAWLESAMVAEGAG